MRIDMIDTSCKLLSLHALTSFLQLLFIFAAAEAGGLSIKLIHRHSPESPFYSESSNITSSERIRLQAQSASAYAAHLGAALSMSLTGTKRNRSINAVIRPKLGVQWGMYMIKVGIGTPSYSYFLHLDTGADTMWTQCEECRKKGNACFHQKARLFPAKQSRTYRPLPCARHKLCLPGECLGPTCSYSISYGDGASSEGYLASESFTFGSIRNKAVTIKDIVFGCGIVNKGFVESSKTNLVAGNFGLGPGKHNFLRQKMALTQGRFSYCLPPWDSPHNLSIFLRFGSDIPQRKGLKEIPMSTTPDSSSYSVKLKGISVGNRRLDIPKSMLAQWDDHGGCIMDSGTTITRVPRRVYRTLKEMLLKNHFSRYKAKREKGIINFCYFFPNNKRVGNLPRITFHLQGANLVLPPQVVYMLDRTKAGKKYFCLGMGSLGSDGKTIIGAMQQANKRFIFDTVKRKIYFGPEDCTREAH